ncbi:hypothetical protein INR49_023762, partial [Caranx melampygus]
LSTSCRKVEWVPRNSLSSAVKQLFTTGHFGLDFLFFLFSVGVKLSAMKRSDGCPTRMGRNPFIHELKFTMTEKIKIGLMSVTVFPVRLLLVKGERAPPSEVPILTVAPHSTYFDAIPVTMTMCSIVTKLESRSIPVWGTLISYIRPVFVFRSDQDSRRKTVEEIKRRAQSGGEWPQVLSSQDSQSNQWCYATQTNWILLHGHGTVLAHREIGLSKGPLSIHDCSRLLEFNQLVCRLGLRAGTRDEIDDQAKRARKLQGDRLSLEDFAQFLNLPVTDTLTQVLSLFDQRGDGQIDIRHFVIALSTVHRPSKSLETLRLAFKIYENEKTGEVHEEDLATVLEIMLGVEEVNLSCLFLVIDKADKDTITYDELRDYIDKNPYFVQHCLDFKDHPRKFCVGRPKHSNGQSHDKDD